MAAHRPPALKSPRRRHERNNQINRPMILILQKIKALLGIALCLIGLAGTLVPVIPGVPIIAAGLALLGADHPLVRELKERWKRWRDGKSSN